MSSFTGVSVITDGKLCTTSAVDAGTDSGYHLLVVKDYSRTAREIPNGKGIQSGPFMVGGHKWHIGYYPNGDEPSCADSVSVYIYCLHDDMEEEAVEAKFEFSFVDNVESQMPNYLRATKTFSFSGKDHRSGYEVFMKRDVLEQSAHLKDDCFTIRCDIMVCNDLNTQEDDGGTMSDIGEHLKILLQEKVGSDVTFEVGGETFPAHRCVLAARSKVFKAQLFGPMMEGITSSAIHIKDMEAKVFAALLSFIYTDSFPEMDKDKSMHKEGQEEEEEGQEEEAADPVTWLQWLQDLFVAADRCDIQQLKFLCEKKLSEHIGVSSVASALVLAEKHHCHRLKEACFKFIQVQSLPCLEIVMESEGWKHITMTYPTVLKELIAKFASNQKNNKRKR
uniref:Uncharacterized protein n=2 Tax=Avena sativa TaxID=4498 RepID=A0ACD5YVX2_AVESA